MAPFFKKKIDKNMTIKAEHLVNEMLSITKVINTTLDEAEFEKCFVRLKSIFEELCLYEPYVDFTESPKKELNALKRKKSSAYKELVKRQQQAKSSFSRKMPKYDNSFSGKSDAFDTPAPTDISSTNKLDPLFADAGRIIIENNKVSIGMLQRVLKIGFNKATRIVDQLYDCGVVGEEFGTKPREVVMSLEQFENLLKKIPYMDINLSTHTDCINRTEYEVEKSRKEFISKFDIAYCDKLPNEYDLLKNLDNIYCHSINDEELIEKLLITLMNNSNPAYFKCILCNLSIINSSLLEFNGEPGLLVPVVSDAKGTCVFIDWLYYECKSRYKNFQTFHVKNIESYNSIASADSPMPYFTLLIDEIYDLFRYVESTCDSKFMEQFLFVIMNSQRVGIRLIFLTQYEAHFIPSNFNRFLKLFKHYTQDELKSIIRRLENPSSSPMILPKAFDSPLSIIDNMSGTEFEEYCASLLQSNGFTNVLVTQSSGDHGIDVLAEKDDISYAIQCKCYSSNIGNAAVQQALAGKKFYKKDIAIVLTNQYFTSQAIEEAAAVGVKLWDRDKLNDLVEKAHL